MTLAKLSRSDLANRLREPGVLLRCGPLVMRLGTSLSELVGPLAMLYADFPIEEGDEIHDFEVRVDPASPVAGRVLGRARAFVDGRRAFDPFRRRHALPMFEWAVNWCTFTRPNRYLLLHSAVVERGGRGLLLSGKPGAGKSTLTAGLLFRGWRLFSDEVAVIPPGTRTLLPMPRPIGLKGASIDIVRALSPNAEIGPSAEGTRKGTVAHLRPPADSVRRAGEPADPRWVVFPNFERDATVELKKVSRGLALQRLGHESFNYSMLGSAGFETLAAVVEGCDCYELRFGNLDDAIRCLEEMTATRTPVPVGAGHVVAPPDVASDAVRPEDRVKRASRRATQQHDRPPPAAKAVTPRLLAVLQRPSSAVSLSTSDWISVIAAARHARLLSRLTLLLEDAGLIGDLPGRVEEQLTGAVPVAQQHERIIRWEVGRIQEATRGIDTKVVLLKGAAYVIAGLPAGRGRLVTDVDILLPRADIGSVEAALVAAGWRALKLHPYDQRFYRQWSHELPPLEHERRGSVVDVHHNILPLTGRLRPDAELLLASAVPLHEQPGLLTLGPEDMVLHGAVHLFQDGELSGSVRDLVDTDALLRDFGAHDPAFWNRLVPRARQLGLERPLFYALRYARRMLDTPVPTEVAQAAAAAAPPALVLALMDRLVARSLMPLTGDRGTLGEETSRALLYARSHWLRMPPGLLASHLARKATRRWLDARE